MSRKKSPYMKKKDSYEKDFYSYRSNYSRRGWPKEKRRKRRMVRRKVNQIISQIESQFEPQTSDLLSTQALQKGYRSKTYFYDGKISLRKIVQKKKEDKIRTIILQNFFKESFCNIGCCRHYTTSLHYSRFCFEKKNRFKNFFASLLTQKHGFAQEIAHYLAKCVICNSRWGYESYIRASLETFFQEEPEWKIPILRWLSLID